MKRFYRQVGVEPAGEGWRVTLDGRAIKTPHGLAQIVPTRALAEAMAREWAAQGEEIDPASLILRDLADFAIDIAARDPAGEVSAVMRFAETDTLCYRADPDEPLHARQMALWEPLLCAIEQRHGLRFVRVSGIVYRPQRPATLAALEALLTRQTPFTLAALNTMASLSASLTVALAALEDGADAEALWAIANAEEDWQAEQWGWDWTAQQLRAKKLAEFTAAMEFAQLARLG